jgi:hypothetical protein
MRIGNDDSYALWESLVETQPQLQPDALSLSAKISQYFIWRANEIVRERE